MKQGYHKTQKEVNYMEYTSFDQSYREVTSHLSSQRVSDVQGEIVSESCSCKDQTEDRNR